MLCVLDAEMFSQLSNIVRVIDMDGFTINKKFIARSRVFLEWGTQRRSHIFFYLGVCWSDLSEKDRKT